MKQKTMTMVAVAAGAVCALCIALFIGSVQARADAARSEALARYGGEQVDVCVATRDIAAGERVDFSAIETKPWVAGLLPEGAVRESGDAIGRVATTSILKGEVIAEKRFEAGCESFDVPVGKQAVSVPVKAVQAVGGAIRPGMSVNVYASGDSSTSALASNVVVLAASVSDGGVLSSAETGWLTLALDPERVQEVIAASNKANLHFVIPGESLKGDEADE